MNNNLLYFLIGLSLFVMVDVFFIKEAAGHKSNISKNVYIDYMRDDRTRMCFMVAQYAQSQVHILPITCTTEVLEYIERSPQ